MEPKYLEIVRRIFGEQEIPKGLLKELEFADQIVRQMGGELVSRQAIAVIIISWRNKPTAIGGITAGMFHGL